MTSRRRFYAETEVFSDAEHGLLRDVALLVDLVPHKWNGDWVRCHELARFVARVDNLQVVDGKCNLVEHSWLLTPERNILDVYAVGRLPMVQFVDRELAYRGRFYEAGPDRTDIRHDVITSIAYVVRGERWDGAL